MRRPTINIIGAGNLGKTIARLLVIHNAATIQGICNTSLESGKEAALFIDEGNAFSEIDQLPPADITLIATPDDSIQECCEKLNSSNQLKPGSIVFHCSGSLSSDVLQSTKSKNCLVGSVHPMRSFANPEISVSQYSGTYCAIEGDTAATKILKIIFDSIESFTYTVDSSKKGMYHAAGVFASNYLVTIAERSIFCLEQAGVDNETATKITLSLMQGTLKNLELTLSPEKSLTGPIKRGDTKTVEKHIKAITDMQLSQLYKTLGLATVNIANLPADKRENVESVLSSGLDFEPIKAKL